jgi:hypothetical protein
MRLSEVSPITYTELKQSDIYDFMLLYNELILEAKRKKIKNNG